nr:ankyrin repeat-containing protein ITN1-like [Ipomoea batatas]GMD94812.1 ankyrin repeat-containing protein ITN1-like [Ipomoea batatas]
MILNSKPDLLWEFNSKGQNIFHIAVLHRQKEVFDLIYKFGPFKDLISVQIDNQQNNILHSTAKLRINRSSKESTGDDNPQQPNGSEEDNKEVGNAVPPSQHKIRNKENKTPKQIFAEEHRELLKEGEKWMTDTATSCKLVATLIATMVFAAAFTVPGGNNGDTGTPIFIKRSSFTVFMISDAVAMICSIISIIMFLSILISRFRQDDFLVSLPLKLLVGLTTLFVSIVGMLVAFAVAFSLIFDKAWQPKLIVAFIVAPFALFLLLNFNLWFDTIHSLFLVVIQNCFEWDPIETRPIFVEIAANLDEKAQNLNFLMSLAKPHDEEFVAASFAGDIEQVAAAGTAAAASVVVGEVFCHQRKAKCVIFFV